MRCLLFILLIGTSTAFFAQDTIKNPYDYPIDDPRNPNCPCHKLQQMADEEYKKIQDQNTNTPVIQQQQARQRKNNDSNKNVIQQQENLNDDISQVNIVINVNNDRGRPLWNQTDDNNDNGVSDSEPEQEKVSRPHRREVGTSGGNGSYKKQKKSTKYFYKVGKKWKKTFHKRKKNKRKSDGCFCFDK